MLRKTILIAAAFALCNCFSLYAHDYSTDQTAPAVKPKENLQKHVVHKKLKQTDKPYIHSNRIADTDDRYRVSSYTNTLTKTDRQPKHYNCNCSVTQVNAHQLLIESEKYSGKILMQIINSKGKIVFNEAIDLHEYLYFNIDFLEPGEYTGRLSGVGVQKSFSFSL